MKIRERDVKYTDHRGRERVQRQRFCKACKGWHTLLGDGSMSHKGSFGWSCDGKTMRTSEW